MFETPRPPEPIYPETSRPAAAYASDRAFYVADGDAYTAPEAWSGAQQPGEQPPITDSATTLITPGSHRAEVSVHDAAVLGAGVLEPAEIDGNVHVEEPAPAPPTPGDVGGGDKPPGPPINIGPPGESDGEDEPSSFGVQRFETIELTVDELQAVPLTHEAGIESLFNRPTNKQYVDKDGISEVIRLSSRIPGGSMQIRAERGGAMNIVFTDNRNNATYHTYYRGEDGGIYDDRCDLSILMRDVPLAGEAPDSVIQAQTAGLTAAAESMRHLDSALGSADRRVGNAEMAYINSLARGAEPVEVAFTDLRDIADRRVQSPQQPSLDDAVWAAYELKSYLEEALVKEQEIDDPVVPFIDRDIRDPQTGAWLHVEAGMLQDSGGAGMPFVQLRMEQPVGREYIDTLTEEYEGEFADVGTARFTTYLTYNANDGPLTCVVETRLSTRDNPQLVRGGKIPVNCDASEARAIRNLLRKPLPHPQV